MSDQLRVLIWNEFVHERSHPAVAQIYPRGIHDALREGLCLALPDAVVQTATLQEPEQGLSQKVLENTDVLLWWGHAAHDQVHDAVVDRVQRRVLEGMGLIALHSTHASKIFRRLMGTSCMLRWREAGERERIWIVDPSHPIAEGLGDSEYFELPQTEMYGEFFDIPAPQELVFISWFEGGEVFRSGCTFRRGKGKIFYFRPGHETFPIYYDQNVRRVVANAVRWASPSGVTYYGKARPIPEPLSPIRSTHQADPSLHRPRSQ